MKLPGKDQWEDVMSNCLTSNDEQRFDDLHDVASSVNATTGCVSTLRQGEICDRHDQLHVCLLDEPYVVDLGSPVGWSNSAVRNVRDAAKLLGGKGDTVLHGPF